ncbi:hypothetical protein HPP92_009722 [Vanilla planifolia]|uniref:Uncharacterized protein n=1 Tax=Vanilla planifolia TaxID=51239 RepID=A0A835V6V8_VANPL|nr:hypothetical protein HPP92_009722 [Vanilla planifolia]
MRLHTETWKHNAQSSQGNEVQTNDEKRATLEKGRQSGTRVSKEEAMARSNDEKRNKGCQGRGRWKGECSNEVVKGEEEMEKGVRKKGIYNRRNA